MRVLIVEDETDIASNMVDYLEGKGHAVDSAADGISGMHLAVSNDYDVILLDLNLPGMDGLTLCQKLRQEAKRDTPVLILTARDTLDDKLKGFTTGADDYLVKPFALAEVEARMIALDKRYKGQVAPQMLQVGDIVFDPQTLQVRRKGRLVKLPRKCLQLLQMLMSNPDRVLRHSDLETEIWGDTLDSNDTLRSHMHTLRRALTHSGETDPIQTVHGIGYRIAIEDE